MSILSGNTLTELQTNAVDQGATFLVGASSANSTGIMSIVGNTMGTTSGAANIVGSGIQNAALTASIVSDGLAYISSLLTEEISKATAKILTIPTEKINESFNTYFKSSIIEPKEFVKKLSMGIEKYNEEKAKEAEKHQNDDIQNKSTEKIKDVTKSINDALAKAKDQLNSIAAYTSKGPEWMSKQIEKYSYTILSQTTGNLNKVTEDFDKTKEEWAKSVGKITAQRAAQPINDKTEKAQKKLIEDAERQKFRLIAKAKSATETAIMKIKGLLGG